MSAAKTNWLLDALSPESRNLILAQGKEVELPLRFSVQSPEELPRYHYFITSGLSSIVVILPEGGSSETGLIGHEGLTGAMSLLGSNVPPTTGFQQIAGSGYRIAHGAMKELFAQSAEIRSRVLEFVQQSAMTTSQVAACNNSHDAEARLARWLLMVQDRTENDSFLLTQEFLADMLGTRRTTVAIAAGALQRSGFIEYSRGKVTILSRENLQSAACDCYPVTRRLLSGLYGRGKQAASSGDDTDAGTPRRH